jgi:hypothetical protein
MYDRKDRELFVLLYETASAAGIEVIEDRINHVIFDEHAPYREKNRLILEAIGKTDSDTTYLPPKVRNLLEKQDNIIEEPGEP